MYECANLEADPDNPTTDRPPIFWWPVCSNAGGAGGIRTLYLFNAIEALSQLSYSPVC